MQQITGVDAGLSSMTGKILAGSHILQGAKNSLYQHQMKSAMKHPAGDTKGRENMSDLHGSRVGMMEFRDPNARMDSDLTGNEKEAASERDAGKENSAYPNGQTDAEHETQMEEGMQVSKGTGGQDADASMEAMERDLESGNSDMEQRGMDPEDSGVKTMEQEENSAAGQSMEAMDQDSEGNSVSGSGAGEQEVHTRTEPDGKTHVESGGSSGESVGESVKRERCLTVGRRNPQERVKQPPEKKTERQHVPRSQRIGERSIHRHSQSRGRMQSPRGNKRDSRPRTSPRFRNRKETGDRRKKSRGRFAGKPSGALFRKREALPENRREKQRMKERRAIEPWILRSKRKRRSLPRREEARKSPRNRMEETDM